MLDEKIHVFYASHGDVVYAVEIMLVKEFHPSARRNVSFEEPQSFIKT